MTTESHKLSSEELSTRAARRAEEELAELRSELESLREDRKRSMIKAALRELDGWTISPDACADLIGGQLEMVRIDDGSWTLKVRGGNGHADGASAVDLLLSTRNDAEHFRKPPGMQCEAPKAADSKHARVKPPHENDERFQRWIREAEERGADSSMLRLQWAHDRAARGQAEAEAERARRPKATAADLHALLERYRQAERDGDVTSMLVLQNRMAELASE